MAERPRLFDDIAGLAGGAMSALQGLREEMESQMRARIDDTIRRLDLIRREEFDAVTEMAAKARAGQERAEARLAAIEARLGISEPPHVSEADPASLPPTQEPHPARQDGATGAAGASEADPASMPGSPASPGTTGPAQQG